MFLVVLLDARVLVVDDQGWGDVRRDDAGAKSPRRPARGPALEDQLHLLGSAEIEVLISRARKTGDRAAVGRVLGSTRTRPVEPRGRSDSQLCDRLR
jgi:hypothetical protein